MTAVVLVCGHVFNRLAESPTGPVDIPLAGAIVSSGSRSTMIAAAIISIALTIPKGNLREECPG